MSGSKARLACDQFDGGEMHGGRLLSGFKPHQHRLGGTSSEKGDVAADGTQLGPGQGAFLYVVEADEAEVEAYSQAGLGKACKHAEGD